MKKTTLLLTLGLAVLTPTLSGCFPAVATGVAATAAVAADRRTAGTIVEDEQLEWKISSAIQKALGDRAHVNVTSYNRIVLLTGEVPDEAAKQRAETLAKQTENVRAVVNELIIAAPSSLASRANDASLTTQVKARLVGNRDVPAHLVKVVTEGGVVYLMGLVTRREGDAATYVARTTSGVKRVVRVFEFISEAEAKRLDHAAKQSQNGR
ncbi:BON domain-containing protein [Hydrogenophilus thermoluteolus]|uniref:BON domain-containing protein n=1 Tax=Hydrogenophilus thermoluteolus TaxID=297 RepID=UPI001C63E400|nr:BON domain-containing protein [Hydrogenophilus thermoluteolus]MBW7656810.1 BON domain-containing protein [Hydrogenophilus thermoluteolus]